MSDEHQSKSKSKNLRFWTVLIFAFAILVVGFYFGRQYRSHLLWKYTEWQHNLKKVEKIPNRLMPECNVPEDWVEHSWGCMSFRLPPEASLFKEANKTVAYFCGDIGTLITLSPLSPEMMSFLDASSQMYPVPGLSMTMPRLRLESSAVGANDFRWSMSSEEVRWLSYAVPLRSAVFLDDVKSSESLHRKDWEGVLFFRERLVFFDWQCTTGSTGGYIWFNNTNEEQELDRDIVRKIVQSIKINCP